MVGDENYRFQVSWNLNHYKRENIGLKLIFLNIVWDQREISLFPYGSVVGTRSLIFNIFQQLKNYLLKLGNYINLIKIIIKNYNHKLHPYLRISLVYFIFKFKIIIPILHHWRWTVILLLAFSFTKGWHRFVLLPL